MARTGSVWSGVRDAGHAADVESRRCYDTLWKTLRRYLIEALGIAEAPNSPRPIFRIAAENLLLASGGERWELYVQTRIDTTHDYDGNKAANAIALMPAFIDDAIALYGEMTGERWQ